MNLRSHHLILGWLLVVSGLLNLGVGWGMGLAFAELPLDELDAAFGPGPRVLITGAIAITILMLVFQIFAGYKVLGGGSRARQWIIAGSIPALLGGLSLPVGVYGIWVSAASSKHDNAEPDDATNGETAS